LVYTGVRRTPICAMMGSDVAAEFFATMLDAYLVAGLVPERPDDCDTADGRPATLAFAQARLARMWCADVETFSSRQIEGCAGIVLQAQWRTILGSIERVLAYRRSLKRIVLSGSGEVLGRTILARYQWGTDLPPTSLAELLGSALSEAACAYAVAMLAAQEPFDAR